MSSHSRLVDYLNASYAELQSIDPLTGSESPIEAANLRVSLARAYRQMGSIQEALTGVIHGSTFEEGPQMEDIIGQSPRESPSLLTINP